MVKAGDKDSCRDDMLLLSIVIMLETVHQEAIAVTGDRFGECALWSFEFKKCL